MVIVLHTNPKLKLLLGQSKLNSLQVTQPSGNRADVTRPFSEFITISCFSSYHRPHYVSSIHMAKSPVTSHFACVPPQPRPFSQLFHCCAWSHFNYHGPPICPWSQFNYHGQHIYQQRPLDKLCLHVQPMGVDTLQQKIS